RPALCLMRSTTPLAAIYNGMEATWKWTELTIVGLYKMIVGDISSKNIGGPLTIAKISGEAAAQGPANVIFLIALISINLGILNLLPIPILDGGHLLFFVVEGGMRGPLGIRHREIMQQVGRVIRGWARAVRRAIDTTTATSLPGAGIAAPTRLAAHGALPMRGSHARTV